MSIDVEQLVHILEAALLVAGKPMSIAQLEGLFEHERDKPTRDELRTALESLQSQYENRGIELVEVASGFRLQARQAFTPWLTHMFQEKAPKYSRALMETLVLIAYRQPITRGEIEDVRGVAVSTNIIKTLIEREWVRVLGHRDVPGRPALLGTTRQFLDYFNLKRIDELPTLSEIKDLDQIDPDLAKEMALLESDSTADAADQVTEENLADEVALADSTDDAKSDAEISESVQLSSDEIDEALEATTIRNDALLPDLDLDLGEEEAALNDLSYPAVSTNNGNGHDSAEDRNGDATDQMPVAELPAQDEFADSTQPEARSVTTTMSESETLH